MLSTIIACAVIVAAAIMLWIISIQRRLVVLDENIGNAMIQIGMLLSGRFDALMVLLNMMKGYAEHESEMLIKTIKAGRITISEKSIPDEVFRQEEIFFHVLARLSLITERYPEIKVNHRYIKALDSIQISENMLRANRVIYNNNVTKQGREIRIFPVSLIAKVLGFRPREYLVEQN